MNTEATSIELGDVLLSFLKEQRSASISMMADHIGISYQGARKHVAQLVRDGLVQGAAVRGAGTTGRPTVIYTLTHAGEHLFPKAYDQLAAGMIETVGGLLGDDVLMHVLGAITDARVARFEPELRGLSLEARLHRLKDLYATDDPFTEVLQDGGPVLIERNCPYLNVAEKHPALCSTSVAMLRRLLGYEVVREERFQNGDRRCAFRVLLDRPIASDDGAFRLEPDQTGTEGTEGTEEGTGLRRQG